MPKKYGKNTFILRGYLIFIEEMIVGYDNIPLGKALINIPGRENRIMKIPIVGFGEIIEQMKLHNDEWVEVEGRIEGREHEGRYYSTNKVFELKTLPMHKESTDETEPPDLSDDLPY